MVSPDDVDKYSSALQHVVTALGIIVAGIWVLYTFWGQHVIQKANLDVSLAETNIKKLDQDAFQQPILSISLNTGPTTESGDVIAINSLFRNDGKLALKFQDTELILKQIYNEVGSPVDSKKALRVQGETLDENGALVAFPSRILRAGQERNTVFLIPKLIKGTYFVELRAKYWGINIVDGRFEDSSGDGINAIEQTSIVIPANPRPQAPAVPSPR